MSMCINANCPYKKCPCIKEDCNNCKCDQQKPCDGNCFICDQECDVLFDVPDIFLRTRYVLKELARRVVEHGECCNICNLKEQCCVESDGLPDGEWNPPNNEVCAENIIKRLYKRIDKD